MKLRVRRDEAYAGWGCLVPPGGRLGVLYSDLRRRFVAFVVGSVAWVLTRLMGKLAAVINKPCLVQTGGCLGWVWMTLLCDKPDVVKRVVVWLGLGDIVAIDHLLWESLWAGEGEV